MKVFILLYWIIFPYFLFTSIDAGDSKIKIFITHFSKTHKNWTQGDSTMQKLNIVFADSLNQFYNRERNAVNNLMLRPESIQDKGNGVRQIAWEAYRNFADGKEIKVHVYSNSEELWINKISLGQDYFIFGKIISYDLKNGVGYNRIDNTCDVGILEFELDSLRLLKSKKIIK